MTDQELDKILVVDPVLEEERQKRAKKERERELSDPSIDDLPPSGIEPDKLSKEDTVRMKSWQKAVSPEDVSEERAREDQGLDEED